MNSNNNTIIIILLMLTIMIYNIRSTKLTIK